MPCDSHNSQVYIKANKKKLGKARPFQFAVGKSDTFDSDQMVPVFSLMCPGISLSTLSHDIRLLDILKFKEICNIVSVTVEYADFYTDVKVVDNKLVQRTKYEVLVDEFDYETNTLVERTNENEYSRENRYSAYWQIYHPDLNSTTNIVGDTDIISSFLEAYKITDVTWVHWWDNYNLREEFKYKKYEKVRNFPESGSRVGLPSNF